MGRSFPEQQFPETVGELPPHEPHGQQRQHDPLQQRRQADADAGHQRHPRQVAPVPDPLGQRQLVLVALPQQQSVPRQLIAPPGDFIELCTTLEAGRVIRWRFEADAPVAFHTHFHVDGDVRAPEYMSAVTAAQSRLTPKGDNDYCWLWPT